MIGMSHFVPIKVIIDQEGRDLCSLNEPGMPTIHIKYKYKHKCKHKYKLKYKHRDKCKLNHIGNCPAHSICVIFNYCSLNIPTNSVSFVGNIINVHCKRGIQIMMTRFCSRSMHIFLFRMIFRYEQQMMHVDIKNNST